MTNNCNVFCDECGLSIDNNEKNVSCWVFESTYTEEAVEILQRWDDEHIEITEEEFAERMRDICKSKKGDPEALHDYADELMKSVLKGLCYDKGVAIFDDLEGIPAGQVRAWAPVPSVHSWH